MSFYYDEKRRRAKVVLYAGRDHLGRQRQRTVTWESPNLRQATKEQHAKTKALLDSIANRKVRAETVNGLVDRWQRHRDAKDSPSTVRKRAGMVARIRRDLGPIRLDDLTAYHVDEWLADLTAAGLTATTVANHWSCLRAMLRQGKRWRMVASADAAMDAQPPRRVSDRRPTPPTSAATRLLIESARPDLRIAAMLGAYAGLRRGEVMALRWTDVDGDVLHVRRAHVDVGKGRHVDKAPKSGEPRDVFIDLDLAAALAEHRRRLEKVAAELGGTLAPDAAVLPKLTGDATGRTARPLGWLTLAWQRHATNHGAPGVRFHDLRHHYATEAIDAGVPLPVVQGQLGHLQLSTTQNIYAHAVESGGRAAAEVMRQRRALPAAVVPS